MQNIVLQNSFPQFSIKIDWSIFKIEKYIDGYHKEYYNESSYFSPKLKMEGNIYNGVQNGT